MAIDKHCKHLDAVAAIAIEAGARILDVYERDFEVDVKGDGTPLTEADRAADKVITERLQALTPKIPVVSEESPAKTNAERGEWPRLWLVDPLDGTIEFIKRRGNFTVNIALVENGAPILGVIYVPVTGVTYLACRGQGAFKQTGGVRQDIQARSYTGGRATVVASESHGSEQSEKFFERLRAEEGEFDTKNLGSALKFCLVAEGSADVYPRPEPTSEWDTAAGQCIVEVAGGKVTDASGKPLRYNKPSIINPGFIASGSGNYDWKKFMQ